MKRATGRNVVEVLERLAALLKAEPIGVRRDVAAQVDAMLDELASNDLFGTEGQLDPRGDQR